MDSKFKVVLAVVAGAAFGAAAVQGLHAQVKPKAYSISELEVLDAAAQIAFVPVIAAAQQAAGGRNLRTWGQVVASEASAAPKRVAITEWDSLEKAQAFYKSKDWNDLTTETSLQVAPTKNVARHIADAGFLTPMESSNA